MTSKKVPVVGNFDLNYKLGYHLISALKITPDSMLVSGPESQIQNLKSLPISALSLTDISTNINLTLPIEVEKISDKLKFSKKEVQITGEVRQFTEGTMEVPFSIINLPESVQINTFPKTIEIKYQVEISKFKEIHANSFKVYCDYQQAINGGLSYMVPKLSIKPNFVTSVIITPAKIDFLIQK